ACIGSSCPSRYWWPSRTAAVLDALHARRGTRAVLVGTAADAGFAAAGAARAPRPIVDATGGPTRPQLLAGPAAARLALGPDPGALHGAAALGVPVVSVWGATSAERSAPFGSEARAIVGRAPCAPCFLTTCPIDRVCMQAIDVDAVVAPAVEALAA